MLHLLLDFVAVFFLPVTESGIPFCPQTRGLGVPLETNMLGSYSGEDNCASRASFSVCSNNTGHVTSIMHITKHPWEKKLKPELTGARVPVPQHKKYYETRVIELVLAPEQATGQPSNALGSVHVDLIYQESAIIVFYLFSEKKRRWLTCAMYIANSRVPVFTLNPHRFVFLSLLLSRYRMTNMYVAPHMLSALLVFWRGLTWKMGLVVQAWNPNSLEG